MAVTDRTLPHADHDTFLVAQLAADDVRPGERRAAIELVAGCRECARLHDDLRTIAAATTELSSLPVAVPRPRDFRLTPADAARLRRPAWRRWFGFAASPRLAFTQPLGVGLATLGLVGLLISGSAGSFMATSGALPAPEATVAGAAVREAPSDGADGSSGSEFTTRNATDGGTAASTGPAAGSPAVAPVPSVAAQAPVGPPASAEVQPMVGSPEPSSDSSKVGDSGPAGTPAAERGPGEADSGPGDADADTSATAPAGGPPGSMGWLALVAIGAAVALLRPVATRLVRRR